MSLTSPRFRTSNKLRQAAMNAPPIRKGARGRAVHLIQMALLDLGYSMPRSTGGVHSPDGIFGDETVSVLAAFQRDRRLSDDGILGRDTLTALDREFRSFQHRVRLHFRAIALTNVTFQRIMSDTESVYGQYGIEAFFASGESLLLSPAEQQIFQRIDQNCRWQLTTGEFNQLHGRGTRAPSDDILVYYVDRFQNANLLGCGGHAPNRPACTVARSASQWDTAHEVGHVLLTSSFSPVHVSDRRNLMFPTSRSERSIPMLTDRQVRQMRSSACCKRI